MKRTLGSAGSTGILAALAVLGALVPAARGEDGLQGVTAVASKVAAGYVRTRLASGAFAPESYAFAEGGRWQGELRDPTIDKLRFLDVARVIAAPLAARSYVPARDPKATRLLILVYWGTTAVPAPAHSSVAVDQFAQAQANLAKYMTTSSVDPRVKVVGGGPGADAALSQMTAATIMLNMENRENDRKDFANAAMLGYDSPGLIGTEKGNYARGTAFGVLRDDLYAEIEENRYFVVLMAYDFQLLWKERKHRLLWETRFSISERHNAFDKALPAMAQYASRYFGEPSNGLLRERIPEGRVDLGEVRSLGEVDGAGK
jgi:hypothetical protein